MIEVAFAAADGIQLDGALHPASGPERGAVVMAHGITADRDENGLFVALGARLAAEGFTALRFSFRGHGRSGGSPRGMRISGECLDLEAAMAYLGSVTSSPLSLVASSFGTVSTVLTRPSVAGLVLWNPVLDLRRTFLEPESPRGLELYGAGPGEKGYVSIRGFELDAGLFDEFACHDPRAAFLRSDMPALVIHGDSDRHVSYEIAREAALSRPRTEFHTVVGADHGFPEDREAVVERTVGWLGWVGGS
ncbi:alpha/beta hydrolase [Amycolatopsis sp.]|jgi:pimeloyl-ACP methyl ester carboxylesterase|uniref:alpha/beta hydrolase n=1 Tax=Amycolatopsis sp. TaxID=37632 RepID=UPI002E082B82|nr:alpha/beta fold hydrolase [Amycolatopsis sp.]